MVIWALSAVIQFPTKGFSAGEGCEGGVHANGSAAAIGGATTRSNAASFWDLGTDGTFLDSRRYYTRKSAARRHSHSEPGCHDGRSPGGRTVRLPICLGADKALVRLRSGEYLCVDTNSLDSIDYLLGWEMEIHFLPVFCSFLRANSVVLDIGANFGLYTATSSTFVKDHGRLYSFEANPHTFQLLKRTLYANRLTQNPNVVAVNALVGAAAGRGTLHYFPELLGGASMTDIGQGSGAKRSIELDMLTIDGFLPKDLRVDLVKVDVEGHEPYVVRGMRETVGRSPNIRIFLEFVEAFLANTVAADRFVEEIDSLGLRICRVLPSFRLELIGRGQTPRGANFCLLTRTPEEDIAHARRAGRGLKVRLARKIRQLKARWDKCSSALYRL
jgi:FkbM family methyltransferase